jgi:hypothetical protein
VIVIAAARNYNMNLIDYRMLLAQIDKHFTTGAFYLHPSYAIRDDLVGNLKLQYQASDEFRLINVMSVIVQGSNIDVAIDPRGLVIVGLEHCVSELVNTAAIQIDETKLYAYEDFDDYESKSRYY